MAGILKQIGDKVPPILRNDVGDVIMLTKETAGLVDVWAVVYPSQKNRPSKGGGAMKK